MRSGNALDTASLLLALLRASNIPARYVYGVIEVPIDKMQNWVGGAETPEAAQRLLAQGGVPHLALTRGGKVSALRMEHVWVEAFIDYVPARGAKHRGGVSQGNTWVPMDASFKQYRFQAGMDLEQMLPFDAEGFIAAAKEGATANERQKKRISPAAPLPPPTVPRPVASRETRAVRPGVARRRRCRKAAWAEFRVSRAGHETSRPARPGR